MVPIRKKGFRYIGKGFLLLLIASTTAVYAQDSGAKSTTSEEVNQGTTARSSGATRSTSDLYGPSNPTEEQIAGDAVQPGDIAPPEETHSPMLRSASSGLNQEIIANVEQGIFKRPETKLDWRTYSLFPYKNFAGESVNAPSGIVIHETANSNSTIWNEIAYMDNNWTSAFVHAFVDQDNIVEIHDPSCGAWGAGKIANQYYIHIELVEHPGDKTAFMKSLLNDAHYAAEKLLQFGLTPSRPSGKLNDPSGTIWSHHEVSSYLGGTNHTDPTGYFKGFGYSMAEFFELIQYEYDQLKPSGVNSFLTTGWQRLEDGTMSYWENGKTVTGWKTINGGDYYFNESSIMQTAWQFLNTFWYYLTPANGQKQTGWQTINNGWFYLNDTGEMATNWQNLDAWYYLAQDGRMRTGWQLINNQWHYFAGSGKMAQNWLSLNNQWYYLNTDGAMRTDWKLIDNHWYYFEASGVMCTGWKMINGSWYYFSPSGNMAVGWHMINGAWYYFEASGVMVTGNQTINGVNYTFSSSGSLI